MMLSTKHALLLAIEFELSNSGGRNVYPFPMVQVTIQQTNYLSANLLGGRDFSGCIF